MRLVVADASPLNYLILIEQVGILSTLFESILVPRVVRDELHH
jgi:predicted nucleic acid-binding protein